MKSFRNRGSGWLTGTGAAWCLILVLGWIGSPPPVRAEGPRILGIERRGAELTIRATAPTGVVRLVLEGCRRDDLRAWVPKAVQRVDPGASEVTFVIDADARLELFRVRADASDPLPASFYAGRTNFAGEALAGDPGANGPLRGGVVGAPTAVDGAGAEAPRSVVESDIWVVEGDRLYFFNQYRGLQVIEVTNPDAPIVRGTFSLPGVGEQMYLLGGRQAILLAHDPCNQWGTGAESAVIVVDLGEDGTTPVELARLPMPGRLVESRMVGTALYVATEAWQPAEDGSGSWQSGTWVSAFDLANPGQPETKKPLWYPGSGNVVTATDRFLFVAVTDYSRNWPWKSDLQVVDITAPDGTMSAFASVPLDGRVADKFKVDLYGDVLRVVVEALESPTGGRWVTVLETFRLADPRSVPPVAVAKLDRLELARGERLFATRFDGPRGYLVTFLRIDPLWVVDLSDPADLKISGELEIPGWSTYIRPMGDRLLALGVDDARGWRVAVQLFDVGDPSKPALLAKVPIGEDSSWSEANHDEKALGVFPEAGLLLVPVSEWSGTSAGQGVQLIDLGRDTLAKRGRLDSNLVVPRRATLQKDRVLTISGRELVAADVHDRDRPRITATVELAYPVDRVLVLGDQLLEISGTSARLRPLQGEVAHPPRVELGDLPVWGASLRGTRLHLLQGRPAEVSWEYRDATQDWIGHTNAGVVIASVWDASVAGALRKVGEAKTETLQPWGAEFQAFWLNDELVVWATGSQGWGPWWYRGVPLVAEGIDAVAQPGLVARGLWVPWWYTSTRELLAVGVTAEGQPRILSSTVLDEAGGSAGKVFASGSLIFSARQRAESEVIGTNSVVEKVWVPADPGREARDGEWQLVTNEYPILRWWSKYDLDVTDFGMDPAAPVRRPAVPLPGALEGLSHGGALLYTTVTRTVEGKQTQEAWLEAGAYDGVAVHLVDSVRLADYSAGEGFALTLADGRAYVARGGWEADSVQRLEIWGINQEGRWEAGPIARLSAAPGEVRAIGDLLVARNGGSIDLFVRPAAGPLEPRPADPMPGCYGGDLGRADGDSVRGLWVPLGDFGAVRLGP